MEHKKPLKIKFVDFWPGWDEQHNFLVNTLSGLYDVELSDQPDLVICSCFSDDFMNYDCPRLFFTGENVFPNFSFYDFGIGFDYLDYYGRYLRYPLYLVDELYGSDYELMRTKHERAKEAVGEKTDFCAFVVSNGAGTADPRREQFFEKLCKYQKVNSGGRYLNNIGQPEGVKDKLAFQKKHKFVLAFENTSSPGYTTEKLIQAFAADAVPIYWGDPDVGKVFNTKAFINCHDFSSFEDVIAHVKEIDHDEDQYLEMLSAPALINPNHKEEADEQLKAFLKKIVEMPKEDAIKSNRYRFGEYYFGKIKKERERLQLLDHTIVRKAVELDQWYRKTFRK